MASRIRAFLAFLVVVLLATAAPLSQPVAGPYDKLAAEDAVAAHDDLIARIGLTTTEIRTFALEPVYYDDLPCRPTLEDGNRSLSEFRRKRREYAAEIEAIKARFEQLEKFDSASVRLAQSGWPVRDRNAFKNLNNAFRSLNDALDAKEKDLDSRVRRCVRSNTPAKPTVQVGPTAQDAELLKDVPLPPPTFDGPLVKPVIPEKFCSYAERTAYLRDVFWPFHERAKNNAVKAIDHMADLERRRSTIGYDEGTTSDRYKAAQRYVDAWAPIKKKHRDFAAEVLDMHDRIMAVPIVDCAPPDETGTSTGTAGTTSTTGGTAAGTGATTPADKPLAPLPPGVKRPTLGAWREPDLPEKFCSESAKMAFLVDVYHPEAAVASRNAVRASAYSALLSNLIYEATLAGDAETARALEAEYNAWKPISTGAEADARMMSQMREAILNIPVVDCGKGRPRGEVALTPPTDRPLTQPPTKPKLPAPDLTRPQLATVPPVNTPETFCSETERVAFMNTVYTPAVTIALQNAEKATAHETKLNDMFNNYMRNEGGAGWAAVKAEQAAYKPIADAARAEAQRLQALYSKIRTVPIKPCPQDRTWNAPGTATAVPTAPAIPVIDFFDSPPPAIPTIPDSFCSEAEKVSLNARLNEIGHQLDDQVKGVEAALVELQSRQAALAEAGKTAEAAALDEVIAGRKARLEVLMKQWQDLADAFKRLSAAQVKDCAKPKTETAMAPSPEVMRMQPIVFYYYDWPPVPDYFCSNAELKNYGDRLSALWDEIYDRGDALYEQLQTLERLSSGSLNGAGAVGDKVGALSPDLVRATALGNAAFLYLLKERIRAQLDYYSAWLEDIDAELDDVEAALLHRRAFSSCPPPTTRVPPETTPPATTPAVTTPPLVAGDGIPAFKHFVIPQYPTTLCDENDARKVLETVNPLIGTIQDELDRLELTIAGLIEKDPNVRAARARLEAEGGYTEDQIRAKIYNEFNLDAEGADADRRGVQAAYNRARFALGDQGVLLIREYMNQLIQLRYARDNAEKAIREKKFDPCPKEKCPPKKGRDPITVGSNSQVGSGAQLRSKVTGMALGALAGALGGGGGGGGGGSDGPDLWRCKIKPSEMTLFDDPVTGVSIQIGAKRAGNKMVIFTRVAKSPDKGTFQTAFLEKPSTGETIAPSDVGPCDLWGEWKLTVSWTKSTYVDGQLVKRESGGWSEGGFFKIPGVLSKEQAPDGLWKRMGFSNASNGARQMATIFDVPPNQGLLTYVVHITRPKGDPVTTVPFVLTLTEGPGGITVTKAEEQPCPEDGDRISTVGAPEYASDIPIGTPAGTTVAPDAPVAPPPAPPTRVDAPPMTTTPETGAREGSKPSEWMDGINPAPENPPLESTASLPQVLETIKGYQAESEQFAKKMMANEDCLTDDAWIQKRSARIAALKARVKLLQAIKPSGKDAQAIGEALTAEIVRTLGEIETLEGMRPPKAAACAAPSSTTTNDDLFIPVDMPPTLPAPTVFTAPRSTTTFNDYEAPTKELIKHTPCTEAGATTYVAALERQIAAIEEDLERFELFAGARIAAGDYEPGYINRLPPADYWRTMSAIPDNLDSSDPNARNNWANAAAVARARVTTGEQGARVVEKNIAALARLKLRLTDIKDAQRSGRFKACVPAVPSTDPVDPVVDETAGKPSTTVSSFDPEDPVVEDTAPAPAPAPTPTPTPIPANTFTPPRSDVSFPDHYPDAEALAGRKVCTRSDAATRVAEIDALIARIKDDTDTFEVFVGARIAAGDYQPERIRGLPAADYWRTKDVFENAEYSDDGSGGDNAAMARARATTGDGGANLIYRNAAAVETLRERKAELQRQLEKGALPAVCPPPT